MQSVVGRAVLEMEAGWREVLGEDLAAAWRNAFESELLVSDLDAACPACGSRSLHRWYLQRGAHPRTFRGIPFVGPGWLWEWCSNCLFYGSYMDSWVPDGWISPYDVPLDAVRYIPDGIEAVRNRQVAADGNQDRL
jgi:DNA-directed RNA polymerase subunit RPC12/RpoP